MTVGYSYIGFAFRFLAAAIAVILICPDLYSAESGDSSGSTFVYSPATGDIFRYGIETENDNADKNVANDYVTEKTFDKRGYYYTKAVKSVESNGDVIFEVKFDSIAGQDGSPDFVRKFSYHPGKCFLNDPNDVDTSDYISYFVLINEPFNLRVSRNGEVLEAYGLHKILKNLLAVFKDTLNESEKESVRGSLGSEGLCEIFQSEYLILPDYGIDGNAKDWVRKMKTEVSYWETENTGIYKITERTLSTINVDAKLKVKIPRAKEVEDEGIKITLDDYSLGGDGNAVIDIVRSCVKQKDIRTKMMIRMNLKAKDEEGYTQQSIETGIRVKLLN